MGRSVKPGRVNQDSCSRMAMNDHMPTAFVYYTGVSPLPQLPWSLHHVGPVLVLSLFGGIGALFVALLALGLSFQAVAVESSSVASGVCRASFRNVVHFRDVVTFTAQELKPMLLSTSFAAILVAGGSPCQDISMLHKHRRGLQPERTVMFQHIPRLAQECEARVADLGMSCPVLQLLENVSHGPLQVQRAIDEAMGGPPVTIYGGSFGWVKRTNAFGVHLVIRSCRRLRINHLSWLSLRRTHRVGGVECGQARNRSRSV